MLDLELCKLLKMLTLVNMIIKDMVYGIYDESEQFTHVQKEGNFNHTTLARNVIFFGVDMSFSKHANNKANNIYVMGKDYVQKINDSTIYAEKMYYRNIADPGKKICIKFAL